MAIYTLSSLTTALASRLNDPTETFFPYPELVVEIQNSLRFWNALTGDNRVWWPLQLGWQPGWHWGLAGVWSPGPMPSPWYDLQTYSGLVLGNYTFGLAADWFADLSQQYPPSPRLCYLTDRDVYSWLQWMLLEPQLPNGGVGTAQFGPSDLINAVQRKRDEYLMRTGCTSVVETIATTPGTQRYPLPQQVIQPRRAYWLPGFNFTANAPYGTPFPLPRADEITMGSYQNAWPVTEPSDPQVFMAGTEPPFTIELEPAPGWPGSVELLALECQPALSNLTSTTLLMPSDFVPAIMWGALADLLDSSMEANDVPRAAYARSRFEQMIELQSLYPCVLDARVAEIPVYCDAVETLDSWMPGWRTADQSPPIIGLSGQNLVAYPSATPGAVTLQVVANAPYPVQPNDTIEMGAETVDALLDYAQHTASFKMGGAEFAATMPLLKSIIELAGHRNAKVRALSLYRDVMYDRTQREDAIAPSEQPVG